MILFKSANHLNEKLDTIGKPHESAVSESAIVSVEKVESKEHKNGLARIKLIDGSYLRVNEPDFDAVLALLRGTDTGQ